MHVQLRALACGEPQHWMPPQAGLMNSNKAMTPTIDRCLDHHHVYMWWRPVVEPFGSSSQASGTVHPQPVPLPCHNMAWESGMSN